MSEDLYWLGFSAFPGIGPVKFQALLQQFHSAEIAWHAEKRQLDALLGQAITQKFLQFKNKFSLKEYYNKLEQKNISYLLLKDTNYPHLLAQIYNPPFVLYVKGDKAFVSQAKQTIAVVGTRKMSEYGKDVTEILTAQLVAAGMVIVSGLALGVDGCAHQAAISANGKTIAVLGCGVDCCSPIASLTLYDKIVEQFGAVVSESAFGSAVSKGMFPSRNRIIAGLSLAVLVTEGAADSGALITAQRALELHRPVFAVPGPITSQLSKGPITLIQKGATVVQSADDILISLNIAKGLRNTRKEKILSDVPEEQQIITLLQSQSLHFDEIVRMVARDSGTVGSLLSIMEIKGMIKSLEGGKFGLN